MANDGPLDAITLDVTHLLSLFCQQLDAKTQELTGRYSGQINCKAGCFSCCKRDFNITALEAHRVIEALGTLPTTIQDLIKAQAEDNESPYCPLLLDGHCSVYEARPVLCRVFGFPILTAEALSTTNNDERHFSTCELNFTETQGKLADFSAGYFDQEALATLLNQWNRHWLDTLSPSSARESCLTDYLQQHFTSIRLTNSEPHSNKPH